MNFSEHIVIVETSEAGLVSDDQRDVYGIVLSIVSSILCSFGILANIVNIQVFIQQGLTDTVTISLLALSISDLGAVVMMFGVGICFSPLVVNRDFTVNTFDLSYILGWAHNTFIRISSGLTAFISFERCVCITLPLKVKSIVTRTRTIVAIVCITLVIGTSVAPVFYSSRMGWTTDPITNRTMLTLIFTVDRELVDSISFVINTVLLVPGIYIANVTFTIILIVQLKRKAKWRESVTSGKQITVFSTRTDAEKTDKKRENSDAMTVRDHRVVKMVVLISVISLLCYFPGIATVFTAVLVPEYNMGRKEGNALFVTGTFTLLLQAANSTINIFIYLRMSTKYRITLKELTAKWTCRDTSSFVA